MRDVYQVAVCAVGGGLVAWLASCAGYQQPSYVAANAALPVIVETYKQEQFACVSTAKTKAEAQACTLQVRAAWAPVWGAWDAYRASDGGLPEYCRLVLLLPESAPFSRVACQ